MADTTKIAWADMTWSPWIGCTKVSSGCTNCYAEADFAIRRKRVVWGPHGTRVKTSDAYWKKPLSWNRSSGICQRCAGYGVVASGLDSRDCPDCKCTGVGPRWRVFPSLCDPFEDSPLIPDEWRQDMFKLIDATPNLTWILLTKRPENIRNMWEPPASNPNSIYRDNVWIICSASDQESFEYQSRHLVRYDAMVPVIGLSLEPLIGPINMRGRVNETKWVIVGGESGPNARPCALEWIDDIRRQCEMAKTPCFVKQMGSNPVTENANMWDFDHLGKRIGAAWGMSAAGCRINFDDSKGSDPSEWPEELVVQQFPKSGGTV